MSRRAVVAPGAASRGTRACRLEIVPSPGSVIEQQRRSYCCQSGVRRQVTMTILTHDEIIRRVRAGDIGIDPFYYNYVGPASLDLHLSTQFRVFKRVRDIF